MNKTTSQPVTPDMTIGDVIKKFPDAADVMLGYGLQCVGCAINPYETIKQGAAGHGMDEATVLQMIDEINFAITKEVDYELNPLGVTISPRAIEILQTLAKEDGKDDVKVQIQASEFQGGQKEYFIDFATHAQPEEKHYEWQGVEMFMSPETVELLKPTLIDYLSMGKEEGFKFIDLSEKNETCPCGKPWDECGCKGSGGCNGGGCSTDKPKEESSGGGCCGGGCGK